MLTCDLEEMGWDAHFDEAFRALDLEGVDGSDVGRVSFLDGPHYTVITGHGEVRTRASSKVLELESPAVGDWVVVKITETANMIIKVLRRKGCISRKVPGRKLNEQVIAANIDIVFIVMGLDDDFNPRRLERYLVMVSASGSRPVVLLNKSDAVEGTEAKFQQVLDLSIGADVHAISALKGTGLTVMDTYLKRGVTAALVGSSGVGKSTLINRLLGEERLRTGEVRKPGGKGRHVTTSRELIVLPGGGVLIDNPGIRELQLWGDKNDLDDAFRDIHDLSIDCRFRDCQHLSEPGCAVRHALETGELDSLRYDNYVKMRKELHHLAIRSEKGARGEEKARWKPLMKNMKYYQRYKRDR
ncbi:MAG: ribosome small subunit-dependent GTPase A [Candidatus Thermoplasmatota archaeon]|nr:ribosome small subunit-dependent GTPase A [Candidatus Thermoplasmatota archaeon]